MMIDTVVLLSPYLDENVANEVELLCTRLEGVELFTGEVLYSFTRGELEGSYDSRIRISVERTEFVNVNGIPVRVKSRPYLRVECSLHKIILGHNCYGGSDDFKILVLYLVRFLEERFCVKLPFFLGWRVNRLDVANVFDLGSLDAVLAYIDNQKNFYYSRRKISTYHGGIYFSGVTNTIKFYAKGLEFEKHDYKRIRKFCRKQIDLTVGQSVQLKYFTILKNLDIIKEKANSLLRVEIEIKRKLKDLFCTDSVNGYVFVNDIDVSVLREYFDYEIGKLLNEGVVNMKIVRDSKLVRNRLNEVYGSRLANVLMSTWFELATNGEEYCREHMASSTFRRHKKQLIDAGVAWTNTDVMLRDFSLYPSDFKPLSSDSRCVNKIDKRVIEKLQEVA